MRLMEKGRKEERAKLVLRRRVSTFTYRGGRGGVGEDISTTTTQKRKKRRELTNFSKRAKSWHIPGTETPYQASEGKKKRDPNPAKGRDNSPAVGGKSDF